MWFKNATCISIVYWSASDQRRCVYAWLAVATSPEAVVSQGGFYQNSVLSKFVWACRRLKGLFSFVGSFKQFVQWVWDPPHCLLHSRKTGSITPSFQTASVTILRRATTRYRYESSRYSAQLSSTIVSAPATFQVELTHQGSCYTWSFWRGYVMGTRSIFDEEPLVKSGLNKFACDSRARSDSRERSTSVNRSAWILVVYVTQRWIIATLRWAR